MNKFFKLDWVLIISVFFLLIIGLIIIYSVSFDGSILDPGNLKRQSIAVLIGLGAMFSIAFFDYRKLDANSTKLYFFMLVLLATVIIFGRTVRGHTGWLGYSSFSIQPVELAKLIIIIFLASFLSKKRTQLSIVVRIIASIVLMFFPIFLILKQPDLGSTAIILACWGTLLATSGISKKNLAILLILGAVLVSPSWFFMKNYQKDRIVNFFDPYRDPSGSGYNVIQSTIAVGSGQLFGKGLGHGSQSQLNFLPEKHTDFIFSVIAEELGLFGALSVFGLFGLILWRLKETAVAARDNFGYLFVIGTMAMIFFQVLVNVGMNIGVMPVAGVPLPLLSYGGTSMVVTLASLGVTQSIFLRRKKRDALDNLR